MSNQQQNDNLLSFLKNQSLFNGSPTRKMSSRSRDRKSDRNRSPGANQQYQANYNATLNGPATNVAYDNNRVNASYQTGGNYSSNVQGGVQGGIQGGNYQVQSQLPVGNYQTTTTSYGTTGGVNGQLGVNNQVGANFSSSVHGGNVRNSYEGANVVNNGYTATTTTTTDAIQTGLLSTALAVAGQKTYASSF